MNSEKYLNFKQTLAASNCQKCALGKCRTNIVVDRGNPQSSILVIGEAPGKNDDEEGRAFIGKAGKMFDAWMAEIGLDTNRDMLICNTVKCRPPENRKPHPQEVAACRPYLDEQIQLANPSLIILMGATALRYLDPSKENFAMKEEAGKFFTLKVGRNYPCLVLYHPAALIYNQKLKVAMKEHVQTLKKFLQEKNLLSEDAP